MESKEPYQDREKFEWKEHKRGQSNPDVYTNYLIASLLYCEYL